MSARRYEGKVALVTAGASGIGRATVQGLLREGASVVFADVAAEAGRALEANLRAAGHDATFVRADVSSEAEVEALIAAIVERHGRLDAAMNIVGNLGAADRLGVRVHDSTLEAFNSTLEASLVTAFLCMKHEIAQMLKQGTGGAIANTSSLAGLRVSPDSTPGYVAAKSAVVHLTEYAAVLYAKDRIRVNVIAPGLTATPAVLAAFPAAETRDAMADRTQPMGRMMTPEEQADAYLWVCSDQASAVTGLTIPVDGGWAAR